MVVAMITVRVVQVATDEVVDVIAVRYCLVAATRTVNVICLVAAAVVRSATLGVRLADRDSMLVVVILMCAMQVAVVQVADVIAVLNGGVTAIWAVLVVVVSVLLAAHGSSPVRILRWVGSAWSITLLIRSRTWPSASE